MSSHIVVVGSLNADFVIRLTRFPVPGETLVGNDFQVFPGGKGANQACGAAKLGGSVSMIGQVGNDSQGPWLKENLGSAGVDVNHVHTDPSVSSGVAAITIDADGQNQIIIVPGANGTFTVERLERSRELISRAGLILLQLEVPIDVVCAAARMARASGGLVILDPAPAQALAPEVLALADYVTPNETELAILTGAQPTQLTRDDAAALGTRLLQRGARRVVVKMGSQGALLVTPNKEHFWPAVPVKAVDTTAAGDAFNAAFAVAVSRGSCELEAGYYATAAAACSVRCAGAQPSMPTHATVENLLKTRQGASSRTAHEDRLV